MILRNKKTGDIWDIVKVVTNEYPCWETLKQINADWEDYEDDDLSKIIEWIDKGLESGKLPVMVNDFVEKLMAWKRLKDKGFRFSGWATNAGIRGIDFEVPDSFFSEHNHSFISDETRDDLDLLFGGEE